MRVTTRPIAVPLVDGYARRVRDLRISITDRCNLRCSYCMPAEGMAWLPRTEVLTYEEIARVARVCVERYGFESIRLTGGEPLVRAHVTRLVEMLSPLGVDLALTTNGVKLAEVAHDLAPGRPHPRQRVARHTAPRALPRARRGATSSTG